MAEFDARQWFFNRSADTTVVSKSIQDSASGDKVRIASRVTDHQGGLAFARVDDEIVLRDTPGGRAMIKATFLEDERSIRTLTFQKYTRVNGPSAELHFSFRGNEIDTLINFIAGVKAVPLEGEAKVRLTDEALREIVLDQGQARRIFAKNSELFVQLAQQENLKRDLVAIGYRRQQLAVFERLLTDDHFFAQERSRLNCKPEALWQQFFEANTWIFGYGLSYQFLSKLDERGLEQIVRGRDLTAAGKRTDGLVKTRGIISSLCFIEIKRHDTPLLSTQYRPEAWSPSPELVGGVSQIQSTVQSAIETIGLKLTPSNDLGDPTGEVLFNIEPRSYLIVGSLKEFQSDNGTNIPKYKSFELYRRNTWRPEIITFDELLERARFIVEHGSNSDEIAPDDFEADIPPNDDMNEDIPF